MSQSSSTGPPSPIAIVSLSCRLPGGSNSPEQLWELLKSTGDAWSAVPADRFHETAFYHPDSDYSNGANHQQGGYFVDADLRDFDHSFFRLSGQQAAAMDPQQRMLLEMSFEALEGAGWTLNSCAGSNMSVYVASFAADFERNLYRDPLSLPTYYLTGVEKAILSNRISHAFDLHGPSMTIDTACSGGLVAMHQACQSLRCGESEAAIVGAANLAMGPDQRIGMSRLHLISGSGHCYPFDSRGDGYGRAEGCVVLVLKRLDHALRDRDPVRAVLVNSGVNQDGYTPASITYPNSSAQENLIRDTYTRAGLSPLDVPYVEAHGTGTRAGDLKEITAISKVFLPQGFKRSTPLDIGSMKGHIGHTENTSGLASIAKAILVLEHLQIPGTLGLDEFKSSLPLESMCFPRDLIPWPQTHVSDEARPSRVSINSFGFGGTNAHVILERAPDKAVVSSVAQPRIFLFSAHSQVSLKHILACYRDWIQQHPDVSLEDLSYTLCHRRSLFRWRYSCVADGGGSLLGHLQTALEASAIPPPRETPSVIFIFTGQGAQWLGMARELLINSTSSVFRSSIRKSRDVLLDLGADWDLERELLRPSTEISRLNTAQLAQPVTTAVQIALVSMLRSFNITAGAVLGHSSGEIAAAYAAGHISAQDALLIAYHRGFMADAAATCGMGPGAMLSVGLSECDAAPLIQNLTQGVAGVACVNSPRSVTISGDADAVDEVASRIAALNRQGESSIFCRRLAIDAAYHSHHMQAVAVKYQARLAKLGSNHRTRDKNLREVALFSSVTGKLKSSGFGPGYWTANLVSPVRFSDALQTLAKTHAIVHHNVFLEIGPHSALAGPVRQCLVDPMLFPQMSFDYYSVLQRNVDAITSTLNAAGRLLERGIAVDLQTVSAFSIDVDSAVVLPNLPAYKWDHSQKHFYESRISREYRMRHDPYHDLLGVRAMDATSVEPRWRHIIGLNSLPWLAHHLIDRQPVFPGSGYICMAIEAVRQIQNERRPEKHLTTIALKDVSFLRGLVVPEILGQQTEMQLSLTPHSDEMLTFDFRVTAYWDDEWREHCTGIVSGILSSEDTDDEACDLRLAYVSSSVRNQRSSGATSIEAEELYLQLTEAGNKYGPTFSGIREYTLEPDGSNAFSTAEITDTAEIMPAHHQQPHLIHPATLDTLLHTCLPMVFHRLGRGSVMPVHIDEILVCATSTMPREPKSILNVSTAIQSSQYRTVRTDVCATTGGKPILVASGVEMRSLTPHSCTGGELPSDLGACHRLDWAPDIELLRARDLSSESSLIELINYVLYKHGKPTVLELGIGHADLPLAFLGSLESPERAWPVYEYTAAAADSLQKARKQLVGYPVQYRTLKPESDIHEQGFKPQSYDVVLMSALQSLSRAHSLVKPQGTVIIELKTKSGDDWIDSILQADFNIQLSVYDNSRSSMIIMARPKPQVTTTKSPLRIAMLTHSQDGTTQEWVHHVEHWLQDTFRSVSRSPIQAGDPRSCPDSDGKGSGDCFIIVEDQAQPMLSDPKCFDGIISLLMQPSWIVWLSPSDPLSMHQITGVARTAHSENDKLHLTTVHVASKLLLSHPGDPTRLTDILALALGFNGSAREREYQVKEAGTVMIPRLLPEESLSHAIRCDLPGRCEVDLTHFLNDSRTLSLSQDDIEQPSCGMGTGTAIFHLLNDRPVNVADDEVELETHAFLLSKTGPKRPYCAYAGIVTRVGAAVHELSPGAQVVAMAASLGANRLIVPRGHVGRLPQGIPSVAGARLLIPTMGACHALQGLAHLPPHSKVLIHGVLNALGRATVAVALSIGAVVGASSASADESRRITKEIGISPDLIVPITRSTSPRNIAVGNVDAIVAGAEDIPAQILAYIKPFGRVIILGGDESSTENSRNRRSFKLPRNCTVFSRDTLELLSAQPELLSGLVAQAAAALHYLPLLDFECCVRPIHQVSKALHLIETATCDAIILQADRNSRIMASISSHRQLYKSKWESEHASYLVAGGLGDLGRRLLVLMAQRGARHLITLSRNPCGLEGYRRLQLQLQAINPNCTLYCLVCDLTQTSSVQDAATTVRELQLPPIRGIIQSAALLVDHPLDTMTYEDFVRAARVKVEGTLDLEKVFSSPSLDFFLMLSSAVNIVGAGGQANYNAGNSIQDAISWARRGGKCRYMSLSPGWIEDAAFTKNNQSRINGLRRAGLRPISPGELTRFFDYALGVADDNLEARPAQAVIGFDAISIQNSTTHDGTVHSPLFCHIRASTSPNNVGHTAQSSTDDDFAVANGDLELTLEVIAPSLVNYLSRLIYVDTGRIDRYKTSTLDLGVDSLISIELRNWIIREFDAPLQSSEILVDQTINSLAEKIVSRARVTSHSTDRSSSVADDVNVRTTTRTGFGSTLPGSMLIKSEISKKSVAVLQPLNLPQLALEATLRLFLQSREAICSTDEQSLTARTIREFLHGSGPSLCRILNQMPEERIAEAYERHIYLQRREPLQNYSTFILVHPVTAPTHSQTVRATILTVAAFEFARQVAAGSMVPEELHSTPLDCQYREWLFHAIRHPGHDFDLMKRYSPTRTIVVLRHGQAFEMTFPESREMRPAAIHAAYTAILDASEESQADVSSFTADERQAWAQIRSDLEHQPENAHALAAIDRCAFVVCLDDEAPMTGGERFTQFLLNGPSNWLSNRWYDKPFQLAVAANGVSAGIYEHTKLDGIDSRSLHHHLTKSIFSAPGEYLCSSNTPSVPMAYSVRKLDWRLGKTHVEHIHQIQLRGSSYGVIEHNVVEIESLGSDFMRAHRASPNASAHMIVLLAVYLVDRGIRPAWEIVSLATFLRGRIDWVQTVTPAAKAFIEGAACAVSSNERMLWSNEKQAHLRALFDAATTAHTRLISIASRGHGYVKNMYALIAAMGTTSGSSDTEVPAVFRTYAWKATQRGGPEQDLKIGFMPTVGDQSDEWDEGGFFMEGERGIYIHCAVEEHRTKFSVSAQPAYAGLVCNKLRTAATVVLNILPFETPFTC